MIAQELKMVGGNGIVATNCPVEFARKRPVQESFLRDYAPWILAVAGSMLSFVVGSVRADGKLTTQIEGLIVEVSRLASRQDCLEAELRGVERGDRADSASAAASLAAITTTLSHVQATLERIDRSQSEMSKRILRLEQKSHDQET